uniref:Uncharacterized protein n=1 Tax=Setaria italica TaxID=4555 RepID=K4A2D8_SETIT
MTPGEAAPPPANAETLPAKHSALASAKSTPRALLPASSTGSAHGPYAPTFSAAAALAPCDTAGGLRRLRSAVPCDGGEAGPLPARGSARHRPARTARALQISTSRSFRESQCILYAVDALLEISSRSDKVVRFGTTRALTLKHLPQPQEAYWYFFKTLAFGSMDPEFHPRFVQVAMEMARDNFEIHFWCKICTFLRRFIQKHVSIFGEHPIDLLNQDRPILFGRVTTPYGEFLVTHRYQCSSQLDIPKIGLQDLAFGSVRPLGKFDILLYGGLRYTPPPYYSYIYTCEVQKLKIAGAKRKRS